MPRSFGIACVGVLAVAAIVGAPARAADQRCVADVVTAPPLVIATRPAVMLVGQVISLRSPDSGPEAIVEDDSAGIRVVGLASAARDTAGGDAAPLAVGDTIEVAGRAEADGPGTVVRAARIRVTGRTPLGTPRRCDPEAFFDGHANCRLVEVEGIVEQAWHDAGTLRLEIAASGRLIGATLPGDVAAAIPEIADDPQTLVDARVRVAGPSTSECNQRGEVVRPVVNVERKEWFAVIESAAAPIFKHVAEPPEALGRLRPESNGGHRVRTFGQVVHAAPGETLHLQNGHTGITVGLAKGAIGSRERFVPGDKVEVAGFLDRSGHVAGIRNASATRFDSGPPPEPLVVTPGAILAANGGDGHRDVEATPGDYDGCLVRFSALHIQSQPTADGGVLLVRSIDSFVSVEADAPTFAAIGTTPPQSQVTITGVARVERDPGPSGTPAPRRLSVILRGPDDFRIREAPAWWTPERLLVVLGVTGAVLAAALAWALTLRRRLAIQTRRLAAEMRSRRDAALEFEATLRERNRLAANLHDTLQQTIGGIGFQLDACESAGGGQNPEAGRHFAVARRMVDHAAKELQGSVWAMRGLSLDGRPFAEALAALVARVSEGHDVALDVRCAGPLEHLPEFVSGSVILVIQEAVHNALRHASPRRIAVTVTDDTSAGALRATVTDDGRGFVLGAHAGPRDGHFGIQGMRERAERLGGSLEVRSRPGGGTTVDVIVQRRDYDTEIGTPFAARPRTDARDGV